MVDYSKWDKLEVSDEEDVKPSSPQVTRLGKPTSVTFGQNKIKYAEKTGDAARSVPKSQKGTKRITRSSLCVNGMDYGHYIWDQSDKEIIVRVLLPSEAKAKDTKVNLSEDGLLVCKYKDEIVLQGQLTRDVWGAPSARFTAGQQIGEKKTPRIAQPQLLGVSNEQIEDRSFDWGLEDIPDHIHRGRVIVIRLSKLPPNDLIKEEWWDRLFVSEKEKLDTTRLKGRNTRKDQTAAFQQVWEEAHKEFVERRKSNKILED